MTGPENMEQALNLEAVLAGIAKDLQDLRDGRISFQQANAAADLAKQFMNGVRMVVVTRQHLERQARLVVQVKDEQ